MSKRTAIADPAQVQALIEAGKLFHLRGWVPATGGNFSARLAGARMLITASGGHKGELTAADFLIADLEGRPQNGGKLSYETLLHCQLYRRCPRAGAVLHTHSVANTVLSRRLDRVRLSGYELLKVLDGVFDPELEIEIPVFANTQDIGELAGRVDTAMVAGRARHGYLIRGHGLYVWGETVAQARHRVEALEFMLECELKEKER